jgi:hypothetical protein
MMETQAGTILKGVVQVDEKNTAGKPRPDNIPQPLPSAPLFEAAGLVEPPPKPQKHKAPGKPGPKPGHDYGAFLTMADSGGTVIAVPIERATIAEIGPIMNRCIDKSAAIVTDDLNVYPKIAAQFASHQTVNHSAGEYGRYEKGVCVHTNTAESFHAMVERMIVGVYHHISPKHRHFYLSQASFRWSTRNLGSLGRLAEMLRRAPGRVMSYKSLTAPLVRA